MCARKTQKNLFQGPWPCNSLSWPNEANQYADQWVSCLLWTMVSQLGQNPLVRQNAKEEVSKVMRMG